MLTPDAFVADVHSFLALAGCFHDRAVHLDGRLIEEPIVLLLPDVQTHLIEGALQTINMVGIKPATKISGGG